MAPPLNLTKVAVGCASIDVLADALAARARDGTVGIHTRFRPTRWQELVGGSLYWIIKHRLVARQTILGFDEDEQKHCLIRCDARVIPVRPRPKRAHQGWRYLAGKDAPQDYDADAGDLAEMPAGMAAELAGLGLI
jgi:hypothetical protein